MTDDTLPPYSFPAIRGRTITAVFDGGRITSDGGFQLLIPPARPLCIPPSAWIVNRTG
jgi:hypothetical protein